MDWVLVLLSFFMGVGFISSLFGSRFWSLVWGTGLRFVCRVRVLF